MTSYVEVYFTFLDCDHYNMDFVKLRICSTHFIVILEERKKIVRYTEDFVKWRFVKSRFDCSSVHTGKKASFSIARRTITKNRFVSVRSHKTPRTESDKHCDQNKANV